MPRVTAILVVRNGEQWLDRTLAALAAQTRRPDGVVIVDAGSTDGSSGKLAAAAATQFVTAGASSFGAGISVGLRATAPDEEDEWLWLLSADTAPEQDALRQLLAAVEVAPSVAIAGPKLVDPTDRGQLLSFGESLSGFGATVRLVEGDYDQGQHDSESDVLAVAAAGMLIRRAVWTRLAGFDPGLPTVDAGLDLSVRARLAGFRVIRVPGARVTRGQRPEDFGRRRPTSARARRRLGRIAQLHRRFVYAPGIAMPFHWLALLPLAIIRAIGHLLAKHPGAVGGEFTAAFVAAFDGGVPPARRRLRITRTVGWGTLAPLRVPADELRERRATQRERPEPGREPEPPLVRASFLSGGIGAVVLAAVIGLAMWAPHLGATALQGGALLPLSDDPALLWSQLGWGWREIGVGFEGAADPFTGVLALLGSATWWSTSFSLVLVWAIALPLSALGAWWCATRLTRKAWPPIAAAILWALAPPLLVGLVDGRPGAVLAHVLLPWLVLAAIEGARSWSAAATAALLFAAVTACAPVLFPALLIAALFWAFANPRTLFQLLGIPLPAIVLLGPVVLTQVARGTPLGSIIDPGAAAPFVLPSGWELLLGDPDGSAGGWGGLLAAIGITADGPTAALVPALLLAPLAALALLAIFLPGARRSIPAVLVALTGLATAVASVHLQPAAAGAVALGPWPGSGLSLYWLGLVGAAIVALHALGRAAFGAGMVVVFAAAVAVAPLVVAPHLDAGAPGTAAVSAGNGRLLPAIVLAEGSTDPDLGTLRLEAQDDGSLAARIQRGEGTMLDDQSTLYAGRETLTEDEKALAELAGNLASHSGYDPSRALQEFRLRFVLLPPLAADANRDAREVRQRTEEALDAVAELTPVGVSAYGSLWRFEQLEQTDAPVHDRGPVGIAVLVVQGVVVGVALLLAIPTGRRRRVITASESPEDPAATFDGDPDD
jgi:GT2 family glycosyltransferase